MKITQILVVQVIIALWVSEMSPTRAADAGSEPDWPAFEEVYRLVRSNLTQASEQELNRAAILGFLQQLGPSVTVLTNNAPSAPLEIEKPVSQAKVYDSAYGYFRIRQVETGLVEAFNNAYEDLAKGEKLKGIILDLRFAKGSAYGVAAELADRFVGGSRPLLKWNGKQIRSQDQDGDITLPVALLINKETTGAAEALAALLREAEAGLLIGSATAGAASFFEEFPLSKNLRLRIATNPIEIGDGREVPVSGLRPDVAVDVRQADERLYYDDPYAVIPSKLASRREAESRSSINDDRINEAQLVQRQRDVLGLEPRPVAAPSPEPVITDPALARALDFLKGLAIVQDRN